MTQPLADDTVPFAVDGKPESLHIAGHLPLLLTLSQAAWLLGVSEGTVRNLIKDRELTVVALRRCKRVRRDELVALAESLPPQEPF